MTELLLAALAIGFFGSLHCIGMCGGLVSALCLARPQLWWPGLTAYQLGRLLSYTLLGGLVGSLGAGLTMTGWFGQLQQVLAWLAGGLMILFALYLGGWLPDPFARLATRVSRATGLSHWMGRAANGKHLGAWLMVGLFNGLLPCGLVYAGLALSLRSADATLGALIMACFGLGTLPAMLAAPTVMHKLSPARRGHLLKLAAAALIILGLVTLFRNELHQGHDHASHGRAHSGHTDHSVPTSPGNRDDHTDHHHPSESSVTPTHDPMSADTVTAPHTETAPTTSEHQHAH